MAERDGWPDAAGQFDIHKVREDELEVWEENARLWAWMVVPGHFNWPSVVRSLCAEVRRLRGEQGAAPVAEKSYLLDLRRAHTSLKTVANTMGRLGDAQPTVADAVNEARCAVAEAVRELEADRQAPTRAR